MVTGERVQRAGSMLVRCEMGKGATIGVISGGLLAFVFVVECWVGSPRILLILIAEVIGGLLSRLTTFQVGHACSICSSGPPLTWRSQVRGLLEQLPCSYAVAKERKRASSSLPSLEAGLPFLCWAWSAVCFLIYKVVVVRYPCRVLGCLSSTRLE